MVVVGQLVQLLGNSCAVYPSIVPSTPGPAIVKPTPGPPSCNLSQPQWRLSQGGVGFCMSGFIEYWYGEINLTLYRIQVRPLAPASIWRSVVSALALHTRPCLSSQQNGKLTVPLNTQNVVGFGLGGFMFTSGGFLLYAQAAFAKCTVIVNPVGATEDPSASENSQENLVMRTAYLPASEKLVRVLSCAGGAAPR